MKDKILILGANVETIPLVLTARRLGYLVYVTDDNTNAPAKKFADFACDIDGTDIRALANFVALNAIKGVLVGVADRLVVPYAELCEQLNLPCYSTPTQARLLSNKAAFNEICLSNGLDIIPRFESDSLKGQDRNQQIFFPLFVKPVDGNSGKGMSLCRSDSELKIAISKARAVSATGQFLIEKYMTCDDIFINITVAQGRFVTSAIADRYTTDAGMNGSRVCLAAIYPSRYTSLYRATVEPKLKKMLEAMRLQDGVFMVSGFVEGGRIHFYDPGFRLQGEAPDQHIENQTGFDQKEMLVRFAMADRDWDPISLPEWPDNRDINATLWILCEPGEISRIRGMQDVRDLPAVFKVLTRMSEGDTITESMKGTEGQVFSRIYLSCSSVSDLTATIARIDELISVTDVHGASLRAQFFKYSGDSAQAQRHG